MILGTQSVVATELADRFSRGEAAVELVFKAHQHGVIVKKKIIDSLSNEVFYSVIMDGRYYHFKVKG